MRTFTLSLLCGAAAIAGCGSDGGDTAAQATSAQPAATPTAATEPVAKTTATTKKRAKKQTGRAITTRSSEFGTMLFDARKQAIYVFQNDKRNRSVCYGECAELWPPVYTKGKPRAKGKVRQSLLGTTKRRDGRLQVTYRGRPLYYYAHEEPGEVRCHNVDLNGGLWWVVGPDGKKRP